MNVDTLSTTTPTERAQYLVLQLFLSKDRPKDENEAVAKEVLCLFRLPRVARELSSNPHIPTLLAFVLAGLDLETMKDLKQVCPSFRDLLAVGLQQRPTETTPNIPLVLCSMNAASSLGVTLPIHLACDRTADSVDELVEFLALGNPGELSCRDTQGLIPFERA